jgi:aminopeptidase-like protein
LEEQPGPIQVSNIKILLGWVVDLMFEELKKIIDEEMSGRQAFRYAERIAQYHRIQASPGYRAAANEMMKLLKRDGVNAELVSYPAQFGDRFISHSSFQEWNCKSAELCIEKPFRKRIARFEEEEIAIIQRSIATPAEGITAELVVIDLPEEESSYEILDVRGKIVLVRGNPITIHSLAIEKHGAAGLIFDNLNEYPPFRTRLDMPDARQYTSFWWHTEEEKKSFGFVVSPRIGDELRKQASNNTVILNAKVDAELYDGSFENIEYYIPGKRKEEILLVSHLCHPYPGGQDNASGPGTLMEVMRTLTKLIKDGKVEEPELGIRFLMMPEMTGTCAYFEQNPDRIPYTFAALNLDMVGADQTKGGGPLCIEQPPLATPTFVDRFAYQLVEELAKNTTNFTGTTEYSTVHCMSTRFSGGSDHYIISDPTIGIPCPMLIQWPDKHYHTTEDSIHNLDPSMMKLVGMATLLYSYGLAHGEEQEWNSFVFHHIGKSHQYLSSIKDWLLQQDFSGYEVKDAFSLYTNNEYKIVGNFLRYAELRGFEKLVESINWGKEMLEKEVALISEILEKELSFRQKISGKELSSNEWAKRVYKRKIIGPIRIGDELKRLTFQKRTNWQKKFEAQVPLGYMDFLFYWMNGERTLEDILKHTRYETAQYYPEYAKNLVELGVRLQLIEEVEV